LELFVIKGLVVWIATYLQGVSNIAIWSAIDSPPDTVCFPALAPEKRRKNGARCFYGWSGADSFRL